MVLTVSIGGVDSVGFAVARAIDAGIEGLRLIAVSPGDRAPAVPWQSFRKPPRLVDAASLAEADIVVEAGAGSRFDEIATATLLAGRVFVPVSAAAMLPRFHLLKLAHETGGRIVVPGGVLPGLDLVRALAEEPIETVTLDIHLPPAALVAATRQAARGFQRGEIARPTRVFSGSALRAVADFPSLANAVAALAIAGIGPVRTMIEIWADPFATRHTYTIHVETEAARTTMSAEYVPDDLYPEAGPITWMSVLACLRGLTSPMRAGS